MANVGFKYPKGTHWTQRPENKAKLSAMVSKIRNRPKKKRTHKAEAIIAKQVKAIKLREMASVARYTVSRAAKAETSIVLNGWVITLGHNSVKIEQS